jgi:tRNA threonylcarbamoyladenosine biosynthesis protein TsaB
MILLIDTSQETGTVALSKEGKVLFSEENKIAKEHAVWLHTAVERLISEAKITLHELEAIAVIAGPGSYTGLRVGMAAAKGFCYALKIPLITQNTLFVMAESIRNSAEEKKALICPMIDARRDEVFTALYSLSPKPFLSRKPKAESLEPEDGTVMGQPSTVNDLTEVLQPQAMILDKKSFETNLAEGPIVFSGNGAEKWKKISISPNTIFEPQPSTVQAFAGLVYEDLLMQKWADTIYSEPVYLKEFFTY